MEAETLAQRLGRRLREARFNAGLTVREAVARANLPSHSQLVRYEQGSAQPSLERLAALARVYDTTPAALFSASDEAVTVIATIDHADVTMIEELARVLYSERHGLDMERTAMTNDSTATLTAQARAGIRRVPWRSVALGALSQWLGCNCPTMSPGRS